MKLQYERHLPHQVPPGFPIFLTWNLKGALPDEMVDHLRHERKRLESQPRRTDESDANRKILHDKLLFAMSDRYLDHASAGPLHLQDPQAALIIEDSIVFGVPERYSLFAWTVMGNHVHVLLTPRWSLEKVTQGIKGYTAYKINGVQDVRGRVFWQDESYDHWARDEEEIMRIIEYIENNPVKAGLCDRPEDWPYSSARLRAVWPVGQAFQPDMRW
ncbi:MAG: transposase [Planctomycetota bacterium]|nr:transposase [Planctomycetota bacterium]